MAVGMNNYRRAWLDVMTALALFRVAQDCEAQVAHWRMEGAATNAELEQARQWTLRMKSAYYEARTYYHQCTRAVGRNGRPSAAKSETRERGTVRSHHATATSASAAQVR